MALALEEAGSLHPAPKMIVFAAFQFDPEAAKDIDETKWPGVTLLKVQMNTDLLTDDLKKKRASNESYWLMGQPDVAVVSEQWLVDSTGRMVMPYEFCEVLSGVSGLAKINAIDEGDLRLYAAMAQRGALGVDFADSPRGGLGSREHRRGAGSTGRGEFIQFLGIARGSLAESETLLILSSDLGYMTPGTVESMLSHCAEIGRLLNGLLRSSASR